MKFSIRKVATTLGAGATMSLLMAQSAMAQVKEIQGIEPIGGRSAGGTKPISDYVYQFINIFLWVIGVLAVVYLIYGGVLYITAGGDAEKANKGRTAITNAIIGIVIVVLAIVIYSTVLNTVTTNSTTI
jgi:hypothetical protein